MFTLKDFIVNKVLDYLFKAEDKIVLSSSSNVPDL